MKTGMELLKEWEYDQRNLSGDAALANESCTDEMEAWLREAENAVHESSLNSGARLWIRQRIFGTIPMSTTQKPKQEGEK